MLPTSNFAFLKVHNAQLAQLGALAERYFRDHSGTAVFKRRQFIKLRRCIMEYPLRNSKMIGIIGTNKRGVSMKDMNGIAMNENVLKMNGMNAQWNDAIMRVIESGVNANVTKTEDMKKILDELPMIF